MLAPLAGISQGIRGFDILSSFAENSYDYRTTPDLIKSIAAFDSAGNFNYIKPLLILIGNKDSLLKRFGATGYYEHLGTYLSFIGDYKNALTYFDKPRYLLESKHPLSKEVISEIKAAKIIPFREFLEDAADKNSVIMINEAHHVPQHRVTASSVLDILYEKGFRTLAVEALSNFTGQTFENFIPGQLTGYYTAEPCMSEFLRHAVNLGFSLLPYEYSVFPSKRETRDSMQAMNILDSVHIGPKNKLLVYAGYGHIDDGSFSSSPSMAKYFRTRSGIDPLTIDQYRLMEGNIKTLDVRAYNEFQVVHKINELGIPYYQNKPYLLAQFTDVALLFPKTTYKNARPDWLFKTGLKKEYQVTIPDKLKETAFLVQAYYTEEIKRKEISKLIPADQTYDRDKSYYSLYLGTGNYTVVIRNIDNQIIYSKEISIVK